MAVLAFLVGLPLASGASSLPTARSIRRPEMVMAARSILRPEVAVGNHNAEAVAEAHMEAVEANVEAAEAGVVAEAQAVEAEAECALRLLGGACWSWRDEKQAVPVPFEEATPRTEALKLGPSCEKDWFSDAVASQLSEWMASELRRMRGKDALTMTLSNDDVPVLQRLGLEGTEIEVYGGALSPGAMVTLRNLTLVDIAPVRVSYGMCYDDYEWWQRQDPLTQWLAGRTADGAQVALTHIDVRVEGRWTLRQSTLGGMQVTYDYGSAELTLRGNMMLDYDMHALTTSAMRRCRGNFEIGDLDVVPSLMPEAAAEAMLNPFLPILAQQIGSILCYGGPDPEGGLNVVGAITPKVQFSGGDSVSVQFSGLQGLTNALLREHADVVWLFENRNAERFLPSPPQPPQPPPPPPPPPPHPPRDCWLPCGGASGACRGFCGGSGLCCSTSYELTTADDQGGCPKWAGCDGFHCCVEVRDTDGDGKVDQQRSSHTSRASNPVWVQSSGWCGRSTSSAPYGTRGTGPAGTASAGAPRTPRAAGSKRRRVASAGAPTARTGGGRVCRRFPPRRAPRCPRRLPHSRPPRTTASSSTCRFSGSSRGSSGIGWPARSRRLCIRLGRRSSRRGRRALSST